MARAPNEKVIKAKELFNKGYKLIDIAKELEVPPGTIRRWKSTYNWDNKNERSDNKTSARNKKNNKKEPISNEVEEVVGNSELTDKQKLFCIYYNRCFNATKAYQKAYGCRYESAMVEGSNHLRNPKIKNEIKKLKQAKLNKAMLDTEDIFQKYMDIAFADIGDYLSFRKVRKHRWTKNKDGEDIPIIDPDTGAQEFFEYNVVDLKSSENLDTTLLSEIKQGKGGVSIKLHDKMRALEWLAKHMDMATEEQKLRVEKLKLEVNALSGDDEEVESDGFIEALEGKVDKLWED